MIIKIIPETDMEKRRVKEVEHAGIKEFFMFGNKKENDGDLVDFHDWTGGYRYLIGSLEYFKAQIEFDMNSKNVKHEPNEISLKPTPMVKKGEPKEQKVQQAILAEDVNKVVQIPLLPKEEKPTIIEVEREEEVEEKPEDDQAGI